MREPSTNLIHYDPSLAPMCGGVAAALLFCWYEQLHREAGFPAQGVSRPTLADWRRGLGYTQSCQPWYRHFYRIGVIHLGRATYKAAVLAGREFLSERTGRYTFFSLELQTASGPCILHRNALGIERELAILRGQQPVPRKVSELIGAWQAASDDAAKFISQLEKRGQNDAKVRAGARAGL